MKKLKQQYVCSDCGQDYKQWVGKCKSCNQWNTIKEVTITSGSGKFINLLVRSQITTRS